MLFASSVLKKSYGQQVEQLMRFGINYINKQEFLPLYQARTVALHEKIIQSGFAALGLVSYNGDRMLSRLYIQFITLTPPPLLEGAWAAGTPHNVNELQQKTELRRRYFKRRTQTLRPMEQALSPLVKGYELVMNSAVILTSENERQNRKRE